jgi:hypothetical protein
MHASKSRQLVNRARNYRPESSQVNGASISFCSLDLQYTPFRLCRCQVSMERLVGMITHSLLLFELHTACYTFVIELPLC